MLSSRRHHSTARRIGTPLARLALFIALAACAPASRPAPAGPGAVASAATAPPINTAELPTASDAAADSLLVDIQAVAPSIQVDLRYATTGNFTGDVLPGYQGNRAYLRREAAAALARVALRARADGVLLLVYDAYRPVRATEGMVAWTERAGRGDLVRDGYIASRSRHNLGLAIDLTLVDLATGLPLDMGTPFDEFSAAAHTANAAGSVLANRRRLQRLMESEGFVNYEQEWWHYSYTVPNPVRFDRVIR